MPITETDAIGLHQALSSGLLDEERQKAAALKLQGYADERKRQGLSLFPSIEKQRREQRQTFYSVIEDPKKLDAENGIYQRADAVRPGGGDNMRAEEVTARWMADKYQLPVDEVRKDWKKFAQDYGARNWNEAVVLEAPRFLARVQQEAKAEKQTVDTINTAADEAMKSALRGGDMVADWKAWEAANPEAPKGARKAWEQVQGETLKRLGPDGRAAAMRAVRALQNATGTAENADGWWNEAKRDLVAIKTSNPGKYRMVLEAIKLLGSEGPKDDKGLAQGAGESFARGVEHITRGSMSIFEPFQARLAGWGVTNADDPKALANQIRAGLDVDKDMLDLANGAIDPITPDGWLESGVYMTAGSLPYMLSISNPLGQVAVAGSFSNDAYHDFKASGWEGADAELAAVASGTIQAAVESLSEVVSKIPGVGAVMAKYGVGPGTNWLARFMVRSGVRAGAETVEEIVQQATTPIIRDLAGAILPNVPETPEGQKLKDVMGEFFKADNFVPLLISVLPLGMIGAGLRTAHDKAIVDLVTKNDSMLRAVFSEEDAAAIAAETDPAKRQAMIENKWVAMPTEEMLKRAKALDDENRKKTADAWRAITRAEQMGMIPAVRRGVDGWTVTKDGKTLKVESRQEAVELAYSGLSDYEFQSAASMAQAADEFANLGGGRAEAFEISMSQRSVQQEVDVGRVTPEQAAESVQVFAQMHGLTAEEARAETLAVLGNNKSEMVEGVRTAISRIFGGGNTITVLHEGVHGRWRMGLESGHYTPQQGLAWVRMAEEASGVDFLPTRNDGEVSAEMLDEAITEVASADIIGRRKDSKSHFTPGMISRGVASFAMSQRANAKEAGKFASFLKAWKEFWGQILRNARKLKKARAEGKLGEDFDAFLDDLLGSDAQVRHEAAAAKEAADITTNIDNAPFSLASPAILGRIAEIQGDDTTAREIGLDESYHASRDRTLSVADPLTARDTRQGRGKAGFYTAPVASETEQYQRQGSPFVHRFDIPADARVKILRRAGQVERLSPEQVSEWRNQGFDIVVGKAILGQKVEVVFLRSPANQGSMVDNAPFSLQSRAVPADTSNVYEMPDGAQLVGPTLFSITAYHGTPHKVDKFRLDKIGTGEGAQAYGWGLYFAESRDVAGTYQRLLGNVSWAADGQPYDDSNIRHSAGWNVMEYGSESAAIARLNERAIDADKRNGWGSIAEGFRNEIKQIESGDYALVTEQNTGNLYTVELLPDESDFLDWDKPLSEQSEKVKAAIDRVPLQKYDKSVYKDPRAIDIYSWSDPNPYGGSADSKASAEALLKAGIQGIRYLDGNSRDGGSGTSNYVIFDENLVKILEENGRKVDIAPFSLAPRITPAQDADYLAALKAGDMNMAQRMVDEAAKAAGYGVKAYAGHRSGITTYDPSQKTPFFSKSKEVAESYVDEYSSESDGAEGRGEMDVYSVYLKLGKSLVMDFQGETWQAHPESGDDTDQIAYQAERDGYDSVTFVNIVDDAKSASSRAMPPTDEYAIFKPDAIKSADPVTRDEAGNIIPLSQRFNSESPDIRFSLAPNIETKEFKQWFRNSQVRDKDGFPLVVYHGSPDIRGLFSEGFRKFSRGNMFFASSDYKVANTYADPRRAFDYQNAEEGVIPLYLSIDTPLVINAKGERWRETEKRITEARDAGHDGVIINNVLDDYNTTTATRPTTVYVFFHPTQAKSALTEQMRSRLDGRPIAGAVPNSGAFDPNDPRLSFSLAPRSLASVADTVLASKMRSPEFRDKFYTIAREKLSAFRRDGDWRVDKNGNASRTEGADSFVDRTRTVANIERERKFRQRSRQRELIDSGLSALSDETRLAYDAGLTALEDHHLISAMLNDHGRLMSWSTANEQGKIDAFSGDYDGAPTLPPKWYAKGGGIMPDVMAQYLYDDGHLAEPTTDALWSALSAAIEGVRLQNDAVKKAVSAVREVEKTALRQSKEESEAWAKAEKARIPTAKERQMKALRTLDALLSAFPPEIRGRVGGFVQLAALGTDKAREAEIERRITKLDEVVESEAKKHYGAEVAKLFERAKPKRKAGEKPKGKLGAEIHGMFDRLKAAMSMTDIEADGRADTLEAQIASGDLTPEEEAIALREAGLTRLLGNWYPRTRPTGRTNVKGVPIVETFDSGADAARMGAAYEALKEVLSGAMADSVLQKRAQAEKRQAIREALIQSAGSHGDASFRDAKTIEVQGLGGWFKELSIGGLNFGQALEWAFGDSVEVRALADWERRASNQKEDAIQEAAQSVEDLFTAMAGSRYKGEKLRWALGQKNVKVGTRTLSQLEMLTATMMWMQEDGRRHMEGRLDEAGNPVGSWHYSQAFVDEIEGKLSREAKAVRSFLLKRYADGWAGLDAVYSRLNGVHLPQHANYSPLTVQPQQAPAGMGIDPVTGSVTSGKSTSPGGLKSRSGKIAEPSFRDALQTFMAHTRQMEHWKAYAELVNEARSALANREVGNAVEGATNAQARTVLNNWVDFFAEGGTRDAAAYLALVRGIGKASGRIAGAALIGRLGVLAIQSTQLAAAVAKIPVTSYVKRLSKLMTGNLGWRAAMRSEYIQRRLNEMPPIVRQAMEGLAASKPNRLKYEVARIGRLISGADALFTAGTYAILYDYHIGQAFGLGLRGAEAVAYAENEAQRATDDVAQPTRAGARSILENRSTSPFMRLAWAFASESRKNLGLMVAAGKSGMTKPRFIRAALFATVLNSGISWLIRSAWRDVRDGGDDELFDEDHWSAIRLALGIGTDWLQGIPVFGQLVQSSAFAAAGEYQPEGNLFSGVSRSVNGWERMLSGESQDTLKDIDLILSGLAPFNDTISAASSMSHLARDLKDVSVNFVSE